MTSSILALVDCNNFFVSCERVFRPDLEHRPVVVLSSNDGCAIARSNEAKALGIPMGAPAFKYRELFKKHGVVQFSANFELYGDISDRITRLLMETTARIEVYSIDESFLDLTPLDIPNRTQWARQVRARVLKEIGVPVSIGIAPSKTLAKLGSDISKSDLELGGIFDFVELGPIEHQARLTNTPIDHLWGIGHRLAPRLRAEGISNALHLAQMSPRHARQLMGTHGRQMVAELNGINCHHLEALGKPRQSIGRGRTFGEDTTEFYVVEAALASLTASATHRLRREHFLARSGTVFAMTNKHKPGFRVFSEAIRFNMPTADTGSITTQLVQALQNILPPGQSYHRAGMVLHDFVPEGSLQIDLLANTSPVAHDRSAKRSRAIDAINNRFGKHRIYFAAEDLSHTWQPKHQIRSPRYTSDWDELPVAHIL